jgi:hypothetical protein
MMVASARSPCTISLLKTLLQPDETFFRCPLRLGKTESVLSHALVGPCADAAILLIQLAMVLSIIALDDAYLFPREDGNPAQDLLVGLPALKVRDEILHGNAAGGKLQPAAAINACDGS